MKKACCAPQRVYPSEAATTHHPNFAKKETLNVLGPPLEIFVFRYPIKEVNRYIERLVDAGFEDRVMFGTDQLLWPKLMAYSISIIQNADYLTPQQKRDILYNNAAQFLRIDSAQPK